MLTRKVLEHYFSTYTESIQYSLYHTLLDRLPDKYQISSAGKIHLWILSSTIYIKGLIRNNVLKEEDEGIVLDIFEKYLKNFYFQILGHEKLSTYYINDDKDYCIEVGNKYLFNKGKYEFINLFHSLYYEYRKELQICEETYIKINGCSKKKHKDYFTIYSELNINEKPLNAFITVFKFPFYDKIHALNWDKLFVKFIEFTETDYNKRLYYDFFITLTFHQKNVLENFITSQEYDNRIKSDLKSLIANYNYQKNFKEIESKKCYIATLAYGDNNHQKVQSFRDFRDDYLINYSFGKLFIKYYYKYSPRIVGVLKPYNTINRFIRFVLDMIIKLLPTKK